MDSTPISVSKLRTQIMLQIDYYSHRCLYVLSGVSQNICLRYCQHFLAINDTLESDQRLLCLYLNLLSIPNISLLNKLMLVKINHFCGTCIQFWGQFKLRIMVFTLQILPSQAEISQRRAFTDPAIVLSVFMLTFLSAVFLNGNESAQVFYRLLVLSWHRFSRIW